MRFKLKELAEVFEKIGIGSREAFVAAEESATFGTNCFDLVFSDEPYVALRLYYDSMNDELIPVVVRIKVDKQEHELGKEALEAMLPALLSAEEDEEVILIAARPPKARDLKEMVEMMTDLSRAIRELVGEKGGGLIGYTPADCSRFM
ncbi:MAG: hypothetical protein GXO07_07195 [Crenarchaeota archaeon]|nr:hypothetical protein [Thermoproteota archaeon]